MLPPLLRHVRLVVQEVQPGLLDLVMRPMHGLDILKEIRAHDEDLTVDLLDPEAGEGPGGARIARLETYRDRGTLDEAVRALERDLIQAGLVQTHWNKSALARDLGISRTTLIKKIKEFGLEGPS